VNANLPVLSDSHRQNTIQRIVRLRDDKAFPAQLRSGNSGGQGTVSRCCDTLPPTVGGWA